MRGFTHSGGARRIKASPTGRPDKPDQKEHRERRGVHLVCMRGESQRDMNPTTRPPPPPPLLTPCTTTQAHREKGAEQRCTWSTALSRLALLHLCVCFSSFRLGLHLSAWPALSASQWLLLCPGCQGCTSSGCRRQEAGQQLRADYLQAKYFTLVFP